MCIDITDTSKRSLKPTGLQADFSRVAKCSKLIRDAFHKELFNLREAQLENRLFARVYDALRQDTALTVGSHKLVSNQLGLLEGFEFNNRKRLPRIFNGEYHVTINRRDGLCVLEVPYFDPVYDLRWDGRVTHFKLVAAAAVLDFRGMKYQTFADESDYLNVQQLSAATLLMPLPVKTRRPILVVMGIAYYQFVGSRYFLRQHDGAKSLTVVKVNAD
jgi:hypothetical protein